MKIPALQLLFDADIRALTAENVRINGVITKIRDLKLSPEWRESATEDEKRRVEALRHRLCTHRSVCRGVLERYQREARRA